MIEIDGTTQIIEPGADPALLKKQLRNISDALDNQKTKASGKDSKAITGGSFTYHTIIVGPDGVVHEEKHEKKRRQSSRQETDAEKPAGRGTQTNW